MEFRRRLRVGRIILLIAAVQVITAAFGVSVLISSNPANAAQTVPYKVNFQGRLTDNSGNILTDGLYNVKFRLWTLSAGGTNQWQEDRVITGVDNRIQITNGLFNIQFGDLTAIAPSLFNTGTGSLFLEVELPTPATAACATNGCAVFTEGAMTPRQPLASSPYAFNADTVDGIDAAALVQLSVAQQTGSINVSGNINTAAALQGLTATLSGAGSLTLGTSSGATGSIVVKNGTNANAVTIVSGVTSGAGYQLTLPTALGASGDCLKDTTGAGVLGFGSCGGPGSTLQGVYDGSGSPATITQTAAKGIIFTSSTNVPSVDQLTIDNTASTGVITAGINGINVKYKGGAAAVEAAGMRIDFAPGTTSGGTWSGLRIVANATGPVSGVTSYGLKLEGSSSPGTGTEEGAYIGTGWDIGVDIQSGGMQLVAQTDPAVPVASNLRIYAKDIAGRILPKWLGPSGVDTPFQASLGFNRVSWTSPAGGAVLTTAISSFGSTFTNTGTVANPTPASTNLLTSIRRTTFSSGATAGTVSGHRQSVLQVWRGNAAGVGGFFYTTRFGTSTLAAGNRAFVGLADSVVAPTNVDPTTNATPGRIGLAINANTGNWNLINNITGTAPTVLALGANFPVNTTSLYELVLFSAPNGSSIGYRVNNISTGITTTGSLSVNIPANTTFLAPQFWITNNATAAAAIIDFSGWYLESDN